MRGGMSFVFPVEITGCSLQSAEVWGELSCLLITIKCHDGVVLVKFDVGLVCGTTDGGSCFLPHDTSGFKPLEDGSLIDHNRIFPLGKREYQRYSRLIHDPFR